MNTEKITNIIRTFTAAAVATGSITQAELDDAIDSITDSASVRRDSLITYREAASQLGVSTKTCKRMVDSGELQAKRLRAGCAKSIRVFQSSIDAILTPSSEDAA
jgi:excisionase family DNA binding protein